ncbi:hypothetical protein [Lacisediminihabitans sp.]|jgi:hypothetical protein|uniref:hypothetical protein n=1 Tax=Lacisediminihabitans sp. TaxID=2787631 RepID=UPI002F945552
MIASILALAAQVPAAKFDEESVTPGWVGFVSTFLIAAAVVLLCIDLVRRVRRVRYRGEIREQLEAERLAAGSGPENRDD